MTDNIKPPVSVRRLRAVLALHEKTLSDLATEADRTLSHVRAVLLGKREASPALLERLEQMFTAKEWRFARGETDVLRDDQPWRGGGEA